MVLTFRKNRGAAVRSRNVGGRDQDGQPTVPKALVIADESGRTLAVGSEPCVTEFESRSARTCDRGHKPTRVLAKSCRPGLESLVAYFDFKAHKRGCQNPVTDPASAARSTAEPKPWLQSAKSPALNARFATRFWRLGTLHGFQLTNSCLVPSG
jgi:hypothetical protein